MIRGRILLAFTENDIFVVIYIQTFRAIINAGKFTTHWNITQFA